MKLAGVIAAGEGSRLAKSHPGTPKPLVEVSGAPLCHWVARSLIAAGAEEIVLIHNSRGGAVRKSLEGAFRQVRWDFRQADTASSWETFRLVALALAEKGESFLISTVDSIVPPQQAREFAEKAEKSGAPAALALTSFVDDEKPLWALVENGRVARLGDARRHSRLVTSGMYYMTKKVVEKMPRGDEFKSLRSFLSSLVESGEFVAGIPLSKTLDVDRPEDIREAEGFLKAGSSQW